jgi:hypothetical protein
MVSCVFYSWNHNDSSERNYIVHTCSSLENVGGVGKEMAGVFHGDQDYSCWHENKGMSYKCHGNLNKIEACPMAMTVSRPEIPCELFAKERVHLRESLVSKEKLRENFYQDNGLCLSCGNCFE